MSARFLIFLLIAVLGSTTVEAQKRDASKIRKERTVTEKKIKETQGKLKQNEKQLGNSRTTVGVMKKELDSKTRQITAEEQQLSRIDSHISSVSDSIASLDNELSRLYSGYSASMRKMQTATANKSRFTYLLSASSVNDVLRRLRYLRRFNRWKKQRIEQLKATSAKANEARLRLASLQDSRSKVLQNLQADSRSIEQKLVASTNEVARLQSENKSLQNDLKKSQRRLSNLDADLDRMIRLQEQQRKAEQEKAKKQRAQKNTSGSKSQKSDSPKAAPAPKPKEGVADYDRALSGSFESNKGKLLFPVSGSYKIVKGFGKQKHPELPNVTTENSGVDIGVQSGAKARAIYTGKVSAIFRQEGYGNVVMVRHGNYLSIYANIQSLDVKTGDNLKTGQSIGSIGQDPDGKPYATLHFELRKERSKLNPLSWVR